MKPFIRSLTAATAPLCTRIGACDASSPPATALSSSSPSRAFTTLTAARLRYNNQNSKHQGSNHHHHFRPFTAEDEAQLTSVLTSKPRHVARHIRQSMLQSRRRIAQFRNSVTYLMILLQSQLQKKEISSEDSTVILESIMRECVDLRQGDMAHLLFRATIRFRKYGLQVGYPFVRCLFESYRLDNAKELLKNMADELRNEAPLRFTAVLAYQLSGEHAQAMALLREIPEDTLQTADYCALLESFGASAAYEDIERMTTELLGKEGSLLQRGVSIDAILSTSIVCLRGDAPRMHAVADTAIARRGALSEAAMAALLRAELNRPGTVSTTADAYDVERALRERLAVASLGLAAETAIVAKCSELMARGHEQGDDVMLAKVQHLRTVLDTAIANEQADDLDPLYALALIKGFGVLGRFDNMRAAFDAMAEVGLVKDHRLYDEMLKWYAYAYNLKEVIALKEEMTRKGVFHTAYTYHNVFRVLDKYYPRMVEKYLAEMRGKGMAIEGFMYPTLLRVFAELQDTATVEQLYREMKARTGQGYSSALSPNALTQMIRCHHADPERIEALLHDAEQFGLLANESVQAEIVRWFSDQERREDLEKFIARIPHKSESLYRALLRDATKRRDKPVFDRLLAEVNGAGTSRMSERLFSTVVTGLSHFRDYEGVKAYVLRGSAEDSITRSPFFFADSAAAYMRVGDPRAAEACWEDLLSSGVGITMPVYNRFLDLFMSQNNMSRVQEVLDTMMKRVPPNPVTATTVVDMLGKMGRLTEMEAVLGEMSKSTNAAPTLVTYHQAMNAYAKCGDVTRMEEARERLREAGFRENHITYNILFEGYGRAKRFEHLQELLLERQHKNIPMEEFGYVVLLNYYSRARLGDEAAALVEDMVNTGVHFTSRMLATVATAFSLIGNVAQMERYVGLLLAHQDCRLRDVESVYLIYSRMRDPVRLQELLDSPALPKSEFIYNICVGAFARAGEHNKVAFLLMEMEKADYTLSRNTSVTLSSLLLKGGKVELAQTVLRWRGGGPQQVAELGGATAAEGERARGEAPVAVDDDDAADLLVPAEDAIQEQLQMEVKKLCRRGDDPDEEPLV